MERRRGKLLPPPALTGSPPGQQAAKLKAKRLSRSFRQGQAAAEVGPPQSQEPEFKTPTRIPRSRPDQTRESPHNDSDFQQDIIWDATSPSPNRLGKRGRKHPSGAVNISEIVSRIAPKHGRPEVAEPTLQQWIGDSAAIPCTPDVQVPRPKKKSPRPNGVDDLVKLAKQFDFNMFRQDEEEVEDSDQRSEDVPDCDQDDSPSPHADRQPAPNAAAGTDVQAYLDPHMEDDLDFLFDGPTQHVSGGLSQVSSQLKPALSSEASGKLPTSTNTKGSAENEFEDDWENDDFLNDSLVLEMTQNPQRFTAPLHCSTQRPARDAKPQTAARGAARLGQSAASKADKEIGRQRVTFTLESNPDFCVKRIQTDSWTNQRVDHSSETADGDSQQGGFSYSKGFSVETGSRWTGHTSDTVRPEQRRDQRTTCPLGPEAVSSHIQPAAVSDFLDEDLDAFFSSDPVWDDPADDVLLCEMCEDLENQIRDVDHMTTKQTLTGQTSNPRTALQPSNRAWDNRSQQPANRQTFHQTPPPTTVLGGSGSGGPAGTSLAVVSARDLAAAVQVNRGRGSFRYTQAKSTSGPSSSSTHLQGGGGDQTAAATLPPQGGASKDQFTFRRPNNPVSTGTSRALGKCSAAEIELKKQQAMERRRRRLQAEQNL